MVAVFRPLSVLTIHTDDVDFVHQPMALELVVQRIQEKLGGRKRSTSASLKAGWEWYMANAHSVNQAPH